MIPISLVVENIHSFRGGHRIDFRGMNLAVLSGPNGAGKSTLAYDALLFALYGQTRGDADSIISDGEQSGRVEFAFALGAEAYLVSRHRSRKGGGSTLLSFQCNGQILDGKTVAETQAQIEQTLHMNADLLRQTAFCGQGQAGTFTKAKPAERKAVLGEILRLGRYDRLAEIARAMTRDVQASIEVAQRRREELVEKAGEQGPVGEQLDQVDNELRAFAEHYAELNGKLAEADQRNQTLIRDREADKGRRQRLVEMSADLGEVQAKYSEASTRLETLRRTLQDKPALAEAVAKAETAQANAAAMEEAQQEHDRLKHEAALAEERYEAAFREHKREIETLTKQIAEAQRAHIRDVGRFEEQIYTLRAQAEVLDQVPCRAINRATCDFPLLNTYLPDSEQDALIGATFEAAEQLCTTCPLIAQAREAQGKLPGLETALADLRKTDPWTFDETRLKQLHGQEPGAEHKMVIGELKQWIGVLAYDATRHEALKREAAALPGLQKTMATIERMEAQIAEVQANVEPLQRQAHELADRRNALEEELGLARDWDSLVGMVQRELTEVKQAIQKCQADQERLAQERGALEERLRACLKARAEAANVATEIAASEKRRGLLKVLAEAFGKTGIPALLIEKAVPDLEAAANDVLATLSDGAMTLQLRSQRETKTKGAMVETLDLMVGDDRGYRPYEGYSGGEAMRVDMAIRVAISELLASRAGARCEMLVLDEICAPLDAEGRMLFVQCVEKIEDRFGCVLVITHVKELEDLFPWRIAVTKGTDGSHAEVTAA